MTNDITAGSFVSVTKTNQSSENKQQTVLPSDSFKIVAKIANSSGLSETEKSGLISNVALIDKYAKGSLRTKLLNNVTATTIYLERTGRVKSSASQDVGQAIQQFKQTQQTAPAVSNSVNIQQKQVENVQRRVETFAQRSANVSVSQINNQVSNEAVQAVYERPIQAVAQSSTVNIRQVPTLAEARQSAQQNLEVTDSVNLSQTAQVAQDLALPGSASNEDIPLPGSSAGEVDIPLPGSGSNVEIPVLGSGSYEEVALPGGGSDIEADVAARIAALEERGVPELPLPGGVDVAEVAAQIVALPEKAMESIAEIALPGGGSDNGSVNERAAQVALSV